MSDFNWDDQQDAAPGGFSWDDQEDADKPGMGTSAIRQGLSGLTSGFSDELVGAGEAAGRALGVEGAGSRSPLDMSLTEDGPTLDWQTLRDAYRMARDKERGGLKRDEKYNPGTSMAANLGGAMLSPVNKLGGSASLAKQAGLIGGINGLGGSDKEDLGGMAIDTGVGTALGLGIGKAADVASPLLQSGIEKMSGGARSAAETLAGRALGAERGSIKKLGFDKVKAAGAQALDEGALPIFGGTGELIERNQALKDRGGKMMGEAFDAIDNAGASTFNPLDIATKVDTELSPTYRTAINKGETNQFENTIESILARGDGNIPLREAQRLKQEIKSVAYPGGRKPIDPTPKQQMAMDAYRIVNQGIDDAVAKGTDAVENAGLSDLLAQGKELYGNSKTSEALLRNKQAREQGNKLFGLTDTITGVGALGYGGATDDWKGAGGLMLAKKGLEKYGAKVGAHGLDKISKLLMKSPQLAETFSKNPNVVNSIAQKIESHLSPGIKAADNDVQPYDKNVILQKSQGTKYASVLNNASKRGDTALGATHFILQSTDPEYREQTNREEDFDQ